MDDSASGLLYKELRQDLLPWVLAPLAILGFLLALLQAGYGLPPSPSALGLLILAFVILVWALRRRHRLAAWLLHGSTLLIILLAWAWFPARSVQHALLFPVIGAAITLGVAECLSMTALASVLLAFGAARIAVNMDIYALIGDMAILWCTAFMICIAQRPYATLISWAWQGYEEARRNLDRARDRQLELKHALEDLALATSQTVRLNELLTAARKAVDEARKAKEEFVANVSHELRTPLNMIIGFSDMILETPQVYSRRLPAALLADVAAIKRNSQHLAGLVDDILDLAEADAGRMQLFAEWTSIQQIAREAAEAVTALFVTKGLDLTVDVPDDLPPVYCDHTRIRQVLLNLLSNAGRFTEKGGAQVRAEMRDGMVVVSVADTGPGVDARNLDQLFEPFRQEDQSTRRRYGGTGLGLTISKKFVEMHGGKIWLESELGVGTRAFFSLPVSEPVAEDAPKRWFGPYQEYMPRSRRSVAPKIAPKPRLVVVEEGDTVCGLVERYLDNVEAIPVRSIGEASQAVEYNAAVALVINQIPSAQGGTTSLVPKLAFDIPIISCWVPERRTSVDQVGAQDYLVKPVGRADLLESMQRIAPQARSILLVDDDAEARQLFGRMLASSGQQSYVMFQAADGQTALQLLRKQRPDLLLLDLVMPNGDGFAVLEAKAKEEAIRDIPVIIVSGKDPQREPIVSQTLVVRRQDGLSARDLMLAIQAITRALQPRFGAPAPPETRDASPVCG